MSSVFNILRHSQYARYLNGILNGEVYDFSGRRDPEQHAPPALAGATGIVAKAQKAWRT